MPRTARALGCHAAEARGWQIASARWRSEPFELGHWCPRAPDTLARTRQTLASWRGLLRSEHERRLDRWGNCLCSLEIGERLYNEAAHISNCKFQSAIETDN